MTPDEYCRDKAARGGSSLYYSFLFLSQEQRQALTALHAFCREVGEVTDECHDPQVARTKLQWWREEIQRLFSDSPRHPVSKALQTPVNTYNLPAEHFVEIIDGTEMDIDYPTYPSFKELTLYCHRVASMPAIMSAEILGYSNRQTLKYAHNLGIAMQLTNIIRTAGKDALHGRIHIPLDELTQYGVTAEDLMAGRDTENIRELIKYQVQRNREHYDLAFERLPDVDRYSQHSSLILAEINLAILKSIAKQDYAVINSRCSLTPIRKLWIAWRVMRRERRRARVGNATTGGTANGAGGQS